MLRLFNTLGKKIEPFRPVNAQVVTLFTCGPSVYQRAHIGNFRTFLFEDILVRYLEYKGYRVKRGMNFTDVEDKAIEEAQKRKMTLADLTQQNIDHFSREMKLLRMRRPEYLARASEAVHEAVEIIEQLLARGVAYWHQGSVYFDPLRSRRFGELYGLDLSRWPTRRRRFHKDTYPGMQWNLGDFILWHGERRSGRIYWDTRIGRGRPSWNIQDPSLIFKYCDETLSIYCGGIDNLYRHHDYSRAILESIRLYPMAKYWLHGEHLVVDGQKMSKSRGNIVYTDDLIRRGYQPDEIRFFLIDGRYGEKLNYSARAFQSAAERWREFARAIKKLARKASDTTTPDRETVHQLKVLFEKNMDDNLNVRGAFDALFDCVVNTDLKNVKPRAASGLLHALKDIDQVLCILNGTKG
jgi:cysteinyl-tRNA synthetase